MLLPSGTPLKLLGMFHSSGVIIFAKIQQQGDGMVEVTGEEVKQGGGYIWSRDPL